jgi:hypothetical protein
VPADSSTIQGGLNGASEGDTVLVAPGTYYENITWPSTQGILLISENGPDASIIDGNSSDSEPVISLGSGIDSTTIISGFTIRNGFGGIHCSGSPTITGNIITGNEKQSVTNPYFGGGVLCKNGSSAIITNNIITDNYVFGLGGGIACDSVSEVVIADNVIEDNRTVLNGVPMGGGIFCYNESSVTISGNIITRNSSYNLVGGRGGGGIGCWGSSPMIVSNTILMNIGGISCLGSSPIIDSCAIAYNDGDGVFSFSASEPTISNSSIAQNTNYGVFNDDSTVIVNAENNWWGDATGPFHPDHNPGGLGDSVSDYVDFASWLTEPTIFMCGDINWDWILTPSDGFSILNYLGSGPQPMSCWAANVNGDDEITSADGYYLMNYIGGGPTLDCQPCAFSMRNREASPKEEKHY